MTLSTLSLVLSAAVCGCFVQLGLTKLSKRRKPRAHASLSPSASPAPTPPAPTPAAAAARSIPEAHRLAVLATQTVVTNYIRKRLGANGWGSDNEQLCWLMDATACLLEALRGSPDWNSTQIRRHLAQLDSTLGPGSYWKHGEKQNTPLPSLLETYDVAFERAQPRERGGRDFRRLVHAEAKRTGESHAATRERLRRERDAHPPEGRSSNGFQN